MKLLTERQFLTFSVLIISRDPEVQVQFVRALSGLVSGLDTVSNPQDDSKLLALYDLIILDVNTCQPHEITQIALCFEGEILLLLNENELKSDFVQGRYYLLPPLNSQQIQQAVKSALQRLIETQKYTVQTQVLNRYHQTTIVGNSDKTKFLKQQIMQYAPSKAPILIEGEAGTGKELAARAIHEASGRVGPFVVVNCADIHSDSLATERLFHHGGSLRLANHGTLFLDGIENISADFQYILIQLLEGRTVQSQGGSSSYLIDVRLISASTKGMLNIVNENGFCRELYERLSVLKMNVSPLRDRLSDLRELFPYLTRHLCKQLSLPVPTWLNEYDFFQEKYNWPGNIREVINLIERCLIINKSPNDYWHEYMMQPSQYASKVMISVSHHSEIPEIQPFGSQTPMRGYPSDWSLREIEKSHIQKVVDFYHGNKSAAARQLGISRKTLDRKYKEWQSESD
ncbi:sigma 54-interacting transcriptional regulator [Vibrio ruber]|uniref:sigma-54-dependent transcriptional regulator n=1 Tax=Vibrio ruber TaxID=184755 RepID=UPI0028931F28|nr:sigma 54-interacting transcriptional regulator [Vibrio ruber]WNJ95158.1 sigma 54-interacting transcriptional regulator [Vibrio ruber]